MKTLQTNLNNKHTQGFYELTHGIDVDRFIYQEEMEVQKAWVEELAHSGLLTEKELSSLISKLQSISAEIEIGTFRWHMEDEDIHMNIERAITESLGDLGKKMHLGRSRNDLIATTLKLYLANRCSELSTEALNIAKDLLALAERDLEIILPAYTHSQAAQPIRMSQIWIFHAMNFKNDAARFVTCRKNLQEMMPLGSAAISGTHLEIDLKRIAKKIGFKIPTMNSVHGVSDRDGAIEVAQAISLLGLHISRFCEDVIFYSSSAMKILLLPQEWSSGSSIMPNKRNPDFFEVVRAKGKKLVALSTEILSLNLGITSGYASDFHEQKRIIVLNILDLQKMLPIFRSSCHSIVIDNSRAVELLEHGHILATDVANMMVDKGATFREAYRQVASLVTIADSLKKQVGIDQISFEASVESRTNCGGSSLIRVKESIALLTAEINLHATVSDLQSGQV